MSKMIPGCETFLERERDTPGWLGVLRETRTRLLTTSYKKQKAKRKTKKKTLDGILKLMTVEQLKAAGF